MSTSLKWKVAAIVLAGTALTTAAVMYAIKDAPIARVDM